jgi:hypothetical protein
MREVSGSLTHLRSVQSLTLIKLPTVTENSVYLVMIDVADLSTFNMTLALN